ncbi:ubiquinol-cytochrome C chaperone family protein [Novosphingobium sp.]|uniref:ubiquinol-cytochrome C chaperone family protein n=1 Tax=Novosphingobium sp. TaxID=1874826 RepID=UPI0025E1CFC7|nr:ubiquinol-cytochrome C chaperone family protein [Novosphingobium sp.]MCC6924396.1 ubiquinol-cytochrome C chaperone family protein [Novosphingobium sp.]
MGLLDRLLGRKDAQPDLRPLWHRVVEVAREPDWYARGGIADTVPGRFDCITLVLSAVLIRLERDLSQRNAAARLTELFVSDMDGQLRQSGVGDLVVGKHMGKLVAALGGRLDAYRAGLAAADDAELVEAIKRNTTLIDNADPAAIARDFRTLFASLQATSDAELLAGTITR